MISKITTFPHPQFNYLTPAFARTLTCLAGLFLAGVAYADDSQDDATPWYEVEAIIFTNNQELGLKSETWPENVQDIQYDKVIDLRLPDDPLVLEEQQRLKPALPNPQTPAAAGGQANPATAATPAPAQPAEVPFVMLNSSTFKLNDIDQRLRRSNKYNVVLHLCWRQPTLPPGKSIPVYVYSGMTEKPATPATGATDDTMGPDYPELFGTLRLSVSRYLHMQTDLHLRMPLMVKEEVPVADDQASNSAGGGFGSFFGVNQPSEPKMVEQEHQELTDFPLQESRRLRSTEIHYFDNPMFGMILTVRPYDTNPSEQQ